VGFWIKNKGWSVGLRGLGKMGKIKSKKNCKKLQEDARFLRRNAKKCKVFAKKMQGKHAF